MTNSPTPGLLDTLKIAIQVTTHQLLLSTYELAYVLWSRPELLPPLYRLWEQSIKLSPYTAHQHEPPPKAEIEMTYGEILLPTVQRVFNALNINSQDHLFDLGSGRGRIVLLAASQGVQATGIEMLSSLVGLAKRATRDDFPLAQFIQGDMLTADISNATILWISGTCLLPDTRDALAQRITALPEGTRVVSVSIPLKHPQLPVTQIVRGLTSWGRSPFFLQHVQKQPTQTP